MTRHTYERYRDGYLRSWHGVTIRPSKRADVEAAVSRIYAGRERYEAVSAATGVPWFVIGLIHKMECNCSFAKHLHNGDPLTARTRRVPAGRPLVWSSNGTWEDSAADALKMKSLHTLRDWSLPRIAYELERFNGFGYQSRGVPNPYLWSFTNRYRAGKYVADHVFDANAVSSQSGAMAMLAVMCERDAAIREAVKAPDLASEAKEVAHVPTDESERLPRTPGLGAALARSRTIFGVVLAFFGWLWASLRDLLTAPVDALSEVARHAGDLAEPLMRVTEMLGVAAAWIGAVAVLYGIGIALHARVTAQFNGKVG